MQRQAAVATTLLRLGSVEIAADDFSAAGKWFAQGETILTRLNATGKPASQPDYQTQLNYAQAEIALCNAAPQAIADLDFALKARVDLVPELLGARGRALARNGAIGDAAATADKLVALDPKAGSDLWLAAEVYSLCSANVLTGKPPVTANDAPAQQERYAARAVQLLSQAQSVGFFQGSNLRLQLQYQHIFDPLRSRDDFKKLLAEIVPQPVPASPATAAAK